MYLYNIVSIYLNIYVSTNVSIYPFTLIICLPSTIILVVLRIELRALCSLYHLSHPLPSSFAFRVFFRQGLMLILPGLISNYDPPPSSCPGAETTGKCHPAHLVLEIGSANISQADLKLLSVSAS
jgi:hypothetical protein